MVSPSQPQVPQNSRFESFLKIIEDVVKSWGFALVLSLVLFVLAFVKVVTITVAVALGLAWFISIFGIARADILKKQTASKQVVIILLCAAVIGSGLVWFGSWTIAQLGAGDQAKLEVTNVVGVKAQNKVTNQNGFFLNVFYENKGITPALTGTHRSVVISSDHILSVEEVKSWQQKATSVPLGSDPGPENQIQPGESPKKFFSVPQDDSEITALGPQADDVFAGKKRMYLFVTFKYEDANSGKNVRVSEFCGWFLQTFDVWHGCGNRTYTTPQ